MSNVVNLNIEYFPDSTTGRPVSNGSIYVGTVDTDPKIAGNQKQISVLQENGTTVAVTQPLSTSGGGVPLYNGSPVTILVDGSYSLRVDNSAGSQVYYVPKNTGVEAVESFDSISDLRSITETPLSGQVTILLGYYAPGDGGGGQFYWDATSTETDNNGTIIKATTVTTGRFKRLYSGNINPLWFGVFADFGAGNTDQSTSMQDVIDFCPVGGTVEIPIGKYYFSSNLVIDKYILFKGDTSAGYYSGTQLFFDSCDGIYVTEGYVNIKELQIWGATAPAAVTTDPAANLWGNIGLLLGGTGATAGPSPTFTMQNVHIGYFDTGLLSNSSAYSDPYYQITNCKFFYNNINIGLIGTFPGYFSNCGIRDAYQHGLYARDAYGVVFDNCIFEINGTSNLTYPTDPNADYYGVFIQNGAASTTDIQICNSYFERMQVFADQDTRLVMDNVTLNGAVKVFGKGAIRFDGNISNNMLPQDLSGRWRYTGNPLITDAGYYTRLQMSEGTSMQMYIEDTHVQNTVIPQDVEFVVFSMEVKVISGSADGSFDITPTITLRQSTARTDATDPDKDWNDSEWDWTSSDWQTLSFIHSPRFDASKLDSTVFDLEKLTTFLIVESSDFSINNLDMYVRNISLRLISKKDLSPTHSLYNGFKASSLNIERKQYKMVGVSGATETWNSAIPAGSIVFGATASVTKAVTGATSIDIGPAGTADLFIDGMGVSLGSAGTVADSNGFTSPLIYTAATNIVATAVGGNFTGGDLAIELWYITPTQPTW